MSQTDLFTIRRKDLQGTPSYWRPSPDHADTRCGSWGPLPGAVTFHHRLLAYIWAALLGLTTEDVVEAVRIKRKEDPAC